MPAPRPDYGLLDRGDLAASIFFPTPDPSVAPAGAEDLFFEVEDGVRLGARLYVADQAFPTILYWHGNGEVVGHHDGIAPLYHAAGANLLVVDFRGYGKSTGRPTFAALVEDGPRVAALAHDTLQERGLGGRRFIMGRSLGSHPALETAAHTPEGFAGLIIESGAANLRGLASRADGDPDELASLVALHEEKIRSIRLPVLIIHGEWDQLIPLESAELLRQLLEFTPKELVTIPGAGHNDLLWIGREAYFDAIRRFIAS